MNIFRINNKYVAVAIFLMLAVTLQAQDYGALKYITINIANTAKLWYYYPNDYVNLYCVLYE